MATVYNVNNTRVNSGDRYRSSPPQPRETYRPCPAARNSVNEIEAPVQVGFKEPTKNTDLFGGYNERKKYLTAKYGQHQMRLIRKRLAVEDWVDEELRTLYDAVSLHTDFAHRFINWMSIVLVIVQPWPK